jgi:hypothetical protein
MIVRAGFIRLMERARTEEMEVGMQERATVALAATSGIALLATKATEYAGNPFLCIKVPAIAVGLINALMLYRSPAWQARGRRELSRRENLHLAWVGGTSLACWLTAITAGRMIACW